MYLTAKPALIGRTVRYLLFDLGNTLWHGIDPVAYDAVEKKSNNHAVAVLQELLAPTPLPPIDPKILGQRLRKMVDKQLRGSLRRNPELEPDAALVTAYSLYSLGIPHVDPAMGLRVFEALNVRIPERRVLFDDALHTLNTLKERGFLLGVVTNRHWGGESFHEDLYTMGICPLIDLKNIAISADMGLRKPNPELFRHTLRALNAVPEEAVMIGDSIAADVGGARRLGMFAVWKPIPRLWAEARTTLSIETPEDQESPDHQIVHKATTGELRAASRVEGYLLAYASRRSKKLNMLPGTAQPDLIIEHLSELLDVFKKTGMQ
jgi:FMN phosphatase YigB (HAD superfamily)